MELGIIGLAKSGKTAVFDALTRSSTTHAGVQINLGVAKVRDPRLDNLSAMFQPKRTVYAEVRYVDIPGAPEGLGKSQGIGGEYLSALQRTQALLHVVRAFYDPAVPHLEGSVDPYRDAASMDMELAFSDLAIIERRLQRLEAELKAAKTQDRERIRRETALMERLKEGLGREVPVREQPLTAEEQRLLSAFQFLTAKPLFIVFNIDESQLPDVGRLEDEMRQRFARPGVQVAAMCGNLEAELARMEPGEEEEFRESMGAGQPAAAKVAQLSHQILCLIPFFTVGPDEVRAWTIPESTPAVRAAAAIHSDLERGFIRAEVVSYDDLMACGSIAEARNQGRLRLEGKIYPVKDGDVITFLFNV